MQEGVAVSQVEGEALGEELVSQVGGFGNEGKLSFEGFSSSGNGFGNGEGGEEEMERLINRTINATIVLVVGTFAITKLLTIDREFWQILRYVPQHNWIAYEEALKRNPVLTKMVINRVVYSLGDWIAQAGWKLWPFAYLITYGIIPLNKGFFGCIV
ncbi:hypothetical protein DITRI_Ditri14bG0120500 [Diplodiscus trichospermus]